MASTDAIPVPRKNVAYRVTFPILDADGDLVTGASALDSEVSKDGGTFADCTNEATEIATASGMYYLDLTSTEMNADCVAIIVKTSTSGAKTVPIVIYPQEMGDIKVDVQSILGTLLTETAGQIAAGFKKLFDVASPVFTLVSVNQTGDGYARLGAPAGASHAADVAAVKVDTAAVKVQTDKLTFTVANQVDSNVLDWKSATAPAMTGDAFARLGAPAGASISADIASVQADTDNIQTRIPAALVSGRIDASVGAMATDTITSGAVAASAVTELQGGLSTLDAAAVRTAVGLGSANLDTQLSGINSKTTNLPSDPADASDIAGAFSTVTSTLSTIAGYIDTEVAAIKAKTDNIPASPAAVSDIPTANANADALLDRAAGVETGWTIRQTMRIVLSVLAGKGSGLATTTAKYRDMADSKDRITATVDADGNRTAVTRDAT